MSRVQPLPKLALVTLFSMWILSLFAALLLTLFSLRFYLRHCHTHYYSHWYFSSQILVITPYFITPILILLLRHTPLLFSLADYAHIVIIITLSLLAATLSFSSAFDATHTLADAAVIMPQMLTRFHGHRCFAAATLATMLIAAIALAIRYYDTAVIDSYWLATWLPHIAADAAIFIDTPLSLPRHEYVIVLLIHTTQADIGWYCHYADISMLAIDTAVGQLEIADAMPIFGQYWYFHIVISWYFHIGHCCFFIDSWSLPLLCWYLFTTIARHNISSLSLFSLTLSLLTPHFWSATLPYAPLIATFHITLASLADSHAVLPPLRYYYTLHIDVITDFPFIITHWLLISLLILIHIYCIIVH